jgi:ribulose-phosphate 3-epimerase
MNLTDGYFAVIYFGISNIKIAANHIINGNLSEQYFDSINIENNNAIASLIKLMDRVEEHVGYVFEDAYITGFFNNGTSELFSKHIEFKTPAHIISNSDIAQIITNSEIFNDTALQNLHIMPVSYNITSGDNITKPVGQTSSFLDASFFAFMADSAKVADLTNVLNNSYLKPIQIFDSFFAISTFVRNALVIHLGAAQTRVSLSTNNSVIYVKYFDIGQNDLTKLISEKFNIPFVGAEDIKVIISDALSFQSDQFENFRGISLADIKDTINGFEKNIAEMIYNDIFQNSPISEIPTNIYLSGGGANIKNINLIFNDVFNSDSKQLKDNFVLDAASRFVLKQNQKAIKKYKNSWWRKTIRKIITRLTKSECPVYISSLPFQNLDYKTLQVIENAGITTIHYDFMDGTYTENSAGSALDAQAIINHSNLKLSAHLMVKNPIDLIQKFAKIGATSIIIPAEISDAAKFLTLIKKLKIRCGIALPPSISPLSVARVLPYIDDIVVISVIPGASGQKFIPESLEKIRILREIKKQQKLKFQIIVDGGINDDNSAACWTFGADAIVSGNYLARAKNLKLAVESLLKK